MVMANILYDTYHVTLGAGKASHVMDNVAFCPRRTLVSVNDCVMLSGATGEKKRIN